jgi:hypothetical protein
MVKAFFEFCLTNEWTPRNPARMVKNPRSRDRADLRNERKLPFTDAELRRMHDACETKYGKQDVAWTRVTGDRRTDINRDRGKPRGSAPPTPPYVRVRIRRFGGLSLTQQLIGEAQTSRNKHWGMPRTEPG